MERGNIHASLREDATRAKHALSIPWSHRAKTLVRGFNFKRMRQSEGPWVLSCPFEISESTLITNFPNARFSYHDRLGCDHPSAGLVRKPARKVLNTPRFRYQFLEYRAQRAPNGPDLFKKVHADFDFPCLCHGARPSANPV